MIPIPVRVGSGDEGREGGLFLIEEAADLFGEGVMALPLLLASPPTAPAVWGPITEQNRQVRPARFGGFSLFHAPVSLPRCSEMGPQMAAPSGATTASDLPQSV